MARRAETCSRVTIKTHVVVLRSPWRPAVRTRPAMPLIRCSLRQRLAVAVWRGSVAFAQASESPSMSAALVALVAELDISTNRSRLQHATLTSCRVWLSVVHACMHALLDQQTIIIGVIYVPAFQAKAGELDLRQTLDLRPPRTSGAS